MRSSGKASKADASIRFDILLKLAEGGMAEILLARVSAMQNFSKYVVLKRIIPGRSRDPGFIAMFLDEARLAAQLHHQNIVQVHAIGEEEDSYFFSMEYLHGLDARALMQRLSQKGQRLPLSQAVFIVSQAAAGLHYAHEKEDAKGNHLGIVHRDVSASNIFLTYDGAVKVVDFGVAWAEKRHVETEPGGGLKGKYIYMSPEQAEERPVDRRSDVYSLGAVLYELTVARRAFRPDNPVRKILDDIVAGRFFRPREVDPEVPEELERIILKAMSRLPEDRYESCEEMQDDLEAFALRYSIPISSRGLKDYLEESVGRHPEPWLTGGLEPTEQICITPWERAREGGEESMSSTSGLSAIEIPAHQTVALQGERGSVAPPPGSALSPSPAIYHQRYESTEGVVRPQAKERRWLLPVAAALVTTSVAGVLALSWLQKGSAGDEQEQAPSPAAIEPSKIAPPAAPPSGADLPPQSENTSLAETPASEEPKDAQPQEPLAPRAAAREQERPKQRNTSRSKTRSAKSAKPKRAADSKSSPVVEDVKEKDRWTKDSLFLPSESR